MICSICFLEFYLHTFRKPWQVKPEVPDPIQPDVQPTQTAWASVNVLRICCRTQVHLLMTCLSIDFSKDLFLVYWSLLYIYTCHHSRVAKPIHCAQNVKTVRLCTEFNKSINNIFLICHISKMAAIDLESSTWVKYWNMLWFLWK